MAGPLPSVPTGFLAQPGNGSVYLNWNVVVGATSYNVLRSTDSVNFSTIASPTVTSYSDITGTLGTLYYYEIQAVNANGSSNPTAYTAVTPVDYGQVSLGQVRLASQQRADMVNDGFVSTQEWNSYINQSYTELYDLLVQTYGQEYYVASPYLLTTDARYPALYNLPTNLYKLMGVDYSVGGSNTAWLTLREFSFISRNRYIYGSTPTSFLGVLNLKYRLVGNQIEFVPQPQGNQTMRLWYVPRPSVLLADSDILDGISGWWEYVIVDAAIKALQKQEDDVTVLMQQKGALIKRIESAASNRDIGQSEAVSDIRRLDGSYFGGAFGDGGMGGI